MIFFTADQHFKHQNIIKYCHRPWRWAWEMDEALIANHNAVVTDEDVVYHLGDFAWGDPAFFICRLKGKEHHLILGNHDKVSRLGNWFSTVQPVLLLKVDSKLSIWLAHYAHRVWPQKHYGVVHLYGHSHGTLAADPLCLDVGVDAQGYRPVSLDQVLERIGTSFRSGNSKVLLPSADKYYIRGE